MPGWYDISCGYHGDDGALFVNSGEGLTPTDAFGVEGMYGAGDTVGAGLNMTTGEVFFTLNGQRLDSGRFSNRVALRVLREYRQSFQKRKVQC